MYMTGGLSENDPKWHSKLSAEYAKKAQEATQNGSMTLGGAAGEKSQDSHTESIDNASSASQGGGASTTPEKEPQPETTKEASSDNTEKDMQSEEVGEPMNEATDAIGKGKQAEIQVLCSLSASQTPEDLRKTRKRRSPEEQGAESHTDVVASFNPPKRQKSNLAHHVRHLSAVQETTETSFTIDSDAFQPNDESTPFNWLNDKTTLQSPVPSSPPNIESTTPKKSRKGKLGSPEVQVPRSPPTIATETPLSSPLPNHSSGQEQEGEQEEDGSQPELPPHPLNRVQRNATPEEVPEWMAPPESSSPVKSPEPKHKRLPPRAKQKVPKSLSTATLQSLLPKRRTRARQVSPDEFDIPADDDGDGSGGSGSDDDELSYFPARKSVRGKTPNTQPPSTVNPTNSKRSLETTLKLATNAKATKKKATTVKARRTTKSAKSKTTPLKTSTLIDITDTPTPIDTLDRPPSACSNKENRTKPLTSSPLSSAPTNSSDIPEQDSESTDSVSLPKNIAGTTEIKSLAKKFKQVDEWSLDFEDNSLIGDSSDLGKR
jgi:hypothetical protein